MTIQSLLLAWTPVMCIYILPRDPKRRTSEERVKLTNKRQPHKVQPHNHQHRHHHPQHRLQVHGEPEEARVGRVDRLGARLAALKHPLRVARLGVHLVPPAEADEPPPGNVLAVVEVGREEEDGDDEDHDPEVSN